MSPETYAKYRALMANAGTWAEDLKWQRTASFPESPEVFARQLIWVILNSGMKSAVARQIADRVYPALETRKPIYPAAFRHVGKSTAIEHIWRNRKRLHLDASRASDLVEWCGALPWIGKITKYHAAKNLGANVAKPDRWLERVAGASGETVKALCQRLSSASGDRVAVVDLVIWWACAHGGYRP